MMEEEEFDYLRHFHEKFVQNDKMEWWNSLLTEAIAKEQIAIQNAISKEQIVLNKQLKKLPYFLCEMPTTENEGQKILKFAEKKFIEKGKLKNENKYLEKLSKLPIEEDNNYLYADQSTTSTNLLNEIEENPKLMEKLKKCKKRFIWLMTDKEKDRERARQVLSHEKYAEYVQRLREMDTENDQINYRESRLSNRFMLDESRKMLLDRKNRKPFLCYEEMFDCIHRCYLRPRFGGLRAFYVELKRNYANITMECVHVYLEACGFNLRARHSVQISKWMKEF